MVKFSMRLRCQPGLERGGPVRIGGPVGPHVDGRRRALEHVQVLRRPARCGTTCTAVAPVPMMPTRLSRSFSRFPSESPPVYS